MRADGVMVPAELCGPVLRGLVRDLAEQSRRGGGLSPAPGLAALLNALAEVGQPGRVIGVRAVRQLASDQAAEVIGCSARSARRLAASGVLRATRPGHEWLIEADSAEDFARRRRSAA